MSGENEEEYNEEEMQKEIKINNKKKQASMREWRIGVRILQICDKVRTRENIIG